MGILPGVVAMIFWSWSAVAQTGYVLKGEVADSLSGKGVEYASVAVTDKDSKVVKMLVCDAKGTFSTALKAPGTYTVTVSSVGYSNAERNVTVKDRTTDVGRIRLMPGVEMESVTVETSKPLVRSDVDKLTYSVEADPETPVSTALDILRKVPLISVDAEDNVLLQGQSNYKVLVNGKSSSMMSRNFKEVIRSMPANSIKDIEVITNPSSKYEAEGVGGIINIITTRKTVSGYNGSVGINASTRGGYGGNAYLSAKIGKFTVSGSIYGGHERQPGNTYSGYQENKLSETNRYQTTEGDNSYKGHYLQYQVEASYEIDTFNLVSVSLWGFHMKADAWGGMTSFTRPTLDGDEIASAFRNRSLADVKRGSLSGNFDYQRTFRKPDKTLTFSYKLENNPEKSISETYIEGIVDYPSYRQRSLNDAFMREQTFQIDYTDPLAKNHVIETGAKYIFRQNDSDPETYRPESGDESWGLPVEEDKNQLKYHQHILGVYAGYTFKLTKVSVKAGARAEATWNTGDFVFYDKGAQSEVKSPFDNEQFNLIPYVTFSYSPKQTARLSLSYTQRLSRPGIWYLNPYVNDNDPLNISYGNPHLKAELSHSVKLTYGIFGPKHTLSLDGGASFTDNSIQEISWVDEKGVRTTTYDNIGKFRNYLLNAYYAFRSGAKFSVSTNVMGSYAFMEQVGSDPISNEGFRWNGNLNVRVGLWKKASFSANGYYSSRSITLQGKGSGFYIYSFGLSQKAFKDKVSFNVSVSNPFEKDLKFTNTSDTPSFYYRSDYVQKMRQARFSVNFNFGKMAVQVKKARRGIQNDDLKAGESGGGVGGIGQ